ncbi:cache domain-containing sensor histidine kinase [Paenibacillus daejeonensis]|uniref:cache domain-containing sensor histidine kinase n=1 Tax=Paenibacillus daejeonensis TaxID=135193 RepID=UPI00037564FF|nr:sensor histidine kinase [Paenibacillus daejeonensis]
MRRSLARQLFISFLIVIVFSLSMVGIFSYLESSRAIDEQVEKYMAQVINNAAMQTDNQLMTFERVSNSILSQQIVKRFLDMDPTDSYEFYNFSNQIRKDVFQRVFITYPTQIHMIYILGDHGRSIFDHNQSFSAISVDPSARLQELNAKTPDTGEIAILNTSLLPRDRDEVITVARKIRGYASYDVKGVLAIEFNKQQLTDLWSQLDLGENGYFFILDRFGEVIFGPENGLLEPLLETGVREQILRGENRLIQPVDGDRKMVVSRTSDYSGWSLAVSMPLSELRAPISSIRSTTLVVGLVTLVIGSIIAIRFGRSIVQPIRHLKDGMRETEKGNWTHIEGPARQDEIGGLVHSYNLMVGRLSEMIERVYDAELTNQKTQLRLQGIELERQRAEFQALQLQINPHFLYNTLETINCYAIVQDSDDISEMVEAMAFMLRYSIQTNLEEITIANELNHVRNYLIIFKHRIQRDFEAEVLVPPALLLKKMVRLTLQPLVENVFHHAYPDGIQPHHYIRIDAREEGGRLLISVSDNGIGMSEERLALLRSRLSQNRLPGSDEDEGVRSSRGGIGVMNVHRRIQMVFGNEYGIQIESQLHQGTTVTMVMPQEERSN